MKLSLLDSNKSAIDLLRDIENGRLVHAYLFISDDSEIRQALFKKACLAVYKADKNATVHTQITNENFVDIRYYDAQEKLRIDDIESIILDTHILPVVSEHKMYFIDNADKLDLRYQNKLLKTFEEPPRYVTIVLGVANEAGLLNTIKSRGKSVYIGGLDYKDIERELLANGIEDETAKLAALYSQGNYKKALNFASNESYKQIYTDTLFTFISLKNSRQIPEHLYKNIFNKENISVTLDFLELFLMDILKKLCFADKKIISLLSQSDLNKLTEGFTFTSVYCALDAINQGRAKLYSNIGSTSVAEKILFDILEAKYKWQQ